MKFEEKENTKSLFGEYTFSVTGSDWEKYIKETRKKISKNIKVPGFRSSHIPDSVLSKRIPEQQVLQKAASSFAHMAYYHAKEKLNEYKVKPYNFSKIKTIYEIINKDECKVKFEFALHPIVKVGDWTKIKIKPEQHKVTEQDINKNINSLLERHIIYKVVENRAAKIGDQVIISFSGKINGKSFAGSTGKDYTLELGSNQFIPGFEDKLVGIKKGETKKILVTFPEDYEAKNIAGKEAVFSVTAREIKEKSIPILNDDFVKSLKIKGVETVKEFKKQIYNDLQNKFNQESERKFNEQIIASLMKESEVIIPEMMIEEEFNQILSVFDQQLDKHKIKREDYFKTLNQTEEQLLKQFREDAKARLTLGFIFKHISAKHNLSTTNAEIEEFFKLLAKQANKTIEEVKKEVTNTEDIRFRLTNDKVWKLLVSDMTDKNKNRL